ncbi:PAS domain-containing protein [Leptolyngbya sp. FACHB-261]|nr:PAS domain-containing protein [Leptolyngbya sp. FACHB-261]
MTRQRLLEEVAALRQQLQSLVISADQAQQQNQLLQQLLIAEQAARVEAEQVRQAAQQELTVAQQQLAEVFDLLPDALVQVDTAWRYTLVNKQAEKLLGKARAELLGRSAWEVFPSLLETQAYALCRQAMAEQVSIEYEEFYPTFEKWFAIRLCPSPTGLSTYFKDISQRKQAEAERDRLLQCEQSAWAQAETERRRLKEIFTQLPALFAVLTGPDQVIEFANPTFLRVTGRSEEIIGKTDREVFPETEGQMYFDVHDHVYRTGETVRYDECLSRWDATGNGDLVEGFFNIVYLPLRDAEGQIEAVLSYAIEVTAQVQARRQAETLLENLRQKEEELKLVTDAVPVLISFVDANCCYRFNNRGYEEWFGRPRAEVYGMHLREVLGEAAWQRIRPYAEAALAGQEASFESEIRCRTGEMRYVSVTYIPRLSEQGQVVGFVALIQDISERKQAEIALQSSNRQMINVLESITDGFSAFDRQWRYTYVNQRAAEMVQKTRQELLGRVIWDVLPEAVETALYDQYQRAVAEQVPIEVEAFYPTLNSWFRVRAYPSRAGLSVYYEDITQQKQVETEREQLLKREQTAREQAESANRIKDEFLAVLSHELRTPLNPIVGWARLLRTGRFDDTKTAQALSTIERNAQSLSQLIEDLLDVSRILQGKLILQAVPVDLTVTILAALETVRLAAESKSIQLQTALEPRPERIIGDANRLQQVFWNLLANAIKFTPSTGRIEVALTYTNATARVQISDTGKGIRSDFLPHIFDSFRQADSATTRTFGGLGLGLAIARHIIELHGGTIQAESPGEDQGATFTIRLPLSNREGKVSESSPRPDLDRSLAGIRILVVDDDDDTRELVAIVLERSGAVVTAVPSAQAALIALAQCQPDILVSDIGMPEVDGYMLIDQVRQLRPEQGGQVPAIALTAYASEIDQQRVLEAGFQKHVTKPLDPVRLVNAIADLVIVIDV